MIQIDELTKYYAERKAVGPLSFTIDKGEVVGLLGLNGAGKTTTLRMLSSELLPTSGRINIDGVDLVERPDEVRAKIGYLPDRPPLYGDMLVHEYLTFAARLRRMPESKIARRVEEVIEITALGEYADAPIDILSHGFRQRAGIGQAIVHGPKLLLLDEPISGLDPVQIVEMRQLIRSLRGEHTTVLSSHILSEISETCDRLLVLRDGEIVAAGSEQELASLMGSGRNFEIMVRAPTPGDGGAVAALRQLCAGLAGVTRVKARKEHALQGEVLSAAVVGTRDVREELCKKLVELGYGILALERGSKELENVFLELTGGRDEVRV